MKSFIILLYLIVICVSCQNNIIINHDAENTLCDTLFLYSGFEKDKPLFLTGRRMLSYEDPNIPIYACLEQKDTLYVFSEVSHYFDKIGKICGARSILALFPRELYEIEFVTDDLPQGCIVRGKKDTLTYSTLPGIQSYELMQASINSNTDPLGIIPIGEDLSLIFKWKINFKNYSQVFIISPYFLNIKECYRESIPIPPIIAISVKEGIVSSIIMNDDDFPHSIIKPFDSDNVMCMKSYSLASLSSNHTLDN